MLHGACRPAVALQHPNRRPAKPTVDTHRTQHDPWNESLADWEPTETEENDPNLRFVREQYGQQQLQQDLHWDSPQQYHPPPPQQQQQQPQQRPQQQAARAEPEPLQPVLLPADVTMRALAGLLGAHRASRRGLL